MPDMTQMPPPTGISTAPDPTQPAGASRGLLATLGAIGAAFLAALCCIGPLVFVVFGVGAGFASAFEPLRPLFTALTLGLLAIGFYVVYGRKPKPDAAVCGPDGSCAVPRDRRRDKVMLWIAAVVALVLLTFPQWSLWLV